MTNLLITGRGGRMGQALIQAGNENPETEVTSTHDTGEDLSAAFENVAAAIDFTVHILLVRFLKRLLHLTHLSS